jgi:hypothetical protein
MESPGLAHWDAATRGPRIPDTALLEMRTQPRFAEAARHAATQSLALFDRDPIMTRALKDVGRVILGMIALYLDATGGMTLSKIQAFLVEMRLTSPGRAAAMLIQLRLIGYVVPAEVQPNRRMRVYVPTPRMRAAFHAHFRKDLEALSFIEPKAAGVLARFEEPQIYNPFLVRFGQGLIDAARVHDRATPGLDLFSQRNAGLPILTDLSLAGDAGDIFPPRGPIHFSVAGLARRFGVSRPHVLKLLRDAANAGFLTRDAEAGVGVLSPLLCEQVANYYATTFIGMAACAVSALTAIQPRHAVAAMANASLSAVAPPA